MKNILLILALPFFFLSNNYAQVPGIEWQISLGGTEDDEIYCLQPVTGGYITAGYSSSNNGDVSGNHGLCDFWITKVDFNGNIEWQKLLGGSQCEIARSITETTDGGYAVVGSSYSSDGDVSDNYGDSDIWIVKLNASGTIQWERSIGGAGNDQGNVVKATEDGGYIMAGYVFEVVNGWYQNAIVTKFDAAGDVQWFKIFEGTVFSEIHSIVLSDDGGYVAVGRHSDGLGDTDVWVLKLDAFGELLWQNFFGGSDWRDYANAVVSTIDGGYILAGETLSNDGDVTYNQGYTDCWVIKFNDSGDLQWQRTFGGTGFDYAKSIQQTWPDWGYIISGYTSSNDGDVSGNHGGDDAWVVKLSYSGVIEWQKCLGGSGDDLVFSIHDEGYGNYALAGFSWSNDGDVSENQGLDDALIMKLSPTYDEACSAILIPSDGTVQSGFSNIDATVSSGENAIVPPNLGNDCIISWCDAAITNSVWFHFVAPPTGAVEISTCGMADFDSQIAIYSVGECINFDTYNLLKANDDGEGCPNYTSKMDVYDLTPGQTYYIIVDGYNGATGAFSIQVSPITVSATHEPFTNSPLLAAYPNPSSGQLTIRLEEHLTMEAYSLSDLTGKVVMAVQLKQPVQQTEMELGALLKGVYLLQVRSEGRVFSEKIILQ